MIEDIGFDSILRSLTTILIHGFIDSDFPLILPSFEFHLNLLLLNLDASNHDFQWRFFYF